MVAADWPAVRRIYEEGLATGHSTLEVEAPTWEAWDGAHLTVARLLAEREGVPLAWAALSAVSSRAVYRGVAEVSIYVATAARGAGVGRALLAALVRDAEQAGLWTLQASILAENTASLTLHQRCGFRVVGRRERIGQRLGVWRDSLLLERRSPTVGTP